MRFMALSFAALACVVVVVAAACSDSDDGGTAATPLEAGSDAHVDSGPADGGTDSDAADARTTESLGAACGTESAKCASGFCVDGVCCDQGCTGQCMACDTAGNVGKCTNIPRLEEDTSYVNDAGIAVDCTNAVGGATCDGAGRCLRTINVPCLDGASCLSGQCAGSGTKKCLGATGELCEALAQCASNDCAVGVCK